MATWSEIASVFYLGVVQSDEQLLHQPAERTISYGSGHLAEKVMMRKESSFG
jgi:hypothetical protein